MRKPYYRFLFILFFSFLGNNVNGERNQIGNPILQAWEKYVASPNEENAFILAASLPGKPNNYSFESMRKILESEDFRKLEINAFSGEKNAIDSLFRMLNISDGYIGESLSIELGLLLRINPRIFLIELKLNKKYVPRMDPILRNLGPFSGSESAMLFERQMRIRALESVKDEDLKGVKEECINILKK